MAKVVLPKSGPADHFWSPKVVQLDHICPPKVVLPVHYSFNEFVFKHAKPVLAFFSEENVSGLIAGSVYTISGVHNRFFRGRRHVHVRRRNI